MVELFSVIVDVWILGRSTPIRTRPPTILPMTRFTRVRAVRLRFAERLTVTVTVATSGVTNTRP